MTSDSPTHDDLDTLRKRLTRRLGPRANVPAEALPAIPTQAPGQAVGPPVDLSQDSNGREVAAPHGGSALLVESRLEDLPGGWQRLAENFAVAMADRRSAARRHVEAVGGPNDVQLLFLDIETTGLASSPVFLIGVMVFENGSLVVRQFFARNYAEERAILSLFCDALTERTLLVSFNGKSFDVPYTRARLASCGLSAGWDLPHCDLLHAARRAWKDQLPNCRLQTLETYICRRGVRTDDIDGALIPAAYHAFVRSGDGRQMLRCLKHNRLDLITLADVLLRLPAP